MQQVIGRLQLHHRLSTRDGNHVQIFKMQLHILAYFRKFQTVRPMLLGRFLLRLR